MLTLCSVCAAVSCHQTCLAASCAHPCVLTRLPVCPPGCLQAVIYAATCDWDADKRTKKDGSPLLPHEDLRYYARGVFTWPQVGARAGGMQHGPAASTLRCSYRSHMCVVVVQPRSSHAYAGSRSC